jgi:hypothetical protein
VLVGEQERDPATALTLASKAVELLPQEERYRQTLGLVRYRLGQYKAAVEALERNAKNNAPRETVFDLYCLDRAVSWPKQANLRREEAAELTVLRAEAEAVLQNSSEVRPIGREYSWTTSSVHS